MDLGDAHEFDAAYREHARRVAAAARRVLGDPAAAEDVAQEVFMRLWERPTLFDPARGSLAAFLSVMARSRALDRHRAEGARDRARDRLAEVEALRPATVEAAEHAVERREQSEAVHAALRALPQSQRETVVLAYAGELNSAQIGSLTGVGRATARSRLRLGLGKLRTQLGDERQAA